MLGDADVIIERVGQDELRLWPVSGKNQVFAMAGDAALFDNAIDRIAGDLFDGLQLEAVALQIRIDDVDEALLVVAGLYLGMDDQKRDRKSTRLNSSHT